MPVYSGYPSTSEIILIGENRSSSLFYFFLYLPSSRSEIGGDVLHRLKTMHKAESRALVSLSHRKPPIDYAAVHSLSTIAIRHIKACLVYYKC